MSKEADEKEIFEFLALGIPSGGSPQFKKWQKDVASFGADAPSIFIKAIREGTETQQYAATVGLRYYGYEANGEGYGPEMTYKYKAPGASDWVIVVPLHPPDRAY